MGYRTRQKRAAREKAASRSAALVAHEEWRAGLLAWRDQILADLADPTRPKPWRFREIDRVDPAAHYFG